MKASRLGHSSAIVGVFLGVLACSEADPAEPRRLPSSSTGATCPSTSTITYEGWALPFFESYCLRCHSVTRTAQDDRHGATLGANWDDLNSVRDFADEIDAFAAAGPKGVNAEMPPSGPFPTTDERRKLGEWLACGAPEN
jgi:hypothetical protein